MYSVQDVAGDYPDDAIVTLLDNPNNDLHYITMYKKKLLENTMMTRMLHYLHQN